MSDLPGDSENRISVPRAERCGASDADGVFELRSVVVRYERRPDRCTIYPRRESCCEHVDAWLSADADAFYPLDEMR
ncbi:DUF7511 domain-containing protein [Halobellus captivus]|uniref:DUF7511 domain-containing protein n=1 Tax=Halobellus captivus TaxID=2592614 RepID=UPI0011A20DC1|nr:hypothetical protein [Halobellus captivus]